MKLVGNCLNWLKIAWHGLTLLEMAGNGWVGLEKAKKGWTWQKKLLKQNADNDLNCRENGWTWLKMTKNCLEWQTNAGNGWKLLLIAWNDLFWLGYGWNMLILAWNSWKWLDMAEKSSWWHKKSEKIWKFLKIAEIKSKKKQLENAKSGCTWL